MMRMYLEAELLAGYSHAEKGNFVEMSGHIREAERMAGDIGMRVGTDVEKIWNTHYSGEIFRKTVTLTNCILKHGENGDILQTVFDGCERIRWYGERLKVDVFRQIDSIYDLIARC